MIKVEKGKIESIWFSNISIVINTFGLIYQQEIWIIWQTNFILYSLPCAVTAENANAETTIFDEPISMTLISFSHLLLLCSIDILKAKGITRAIIFFYYWLMNYTRPFLFYPWYLSMTFSFFCWHSDYH